MAPTWAGPGLLFQSREKPFGRTFSGIEFIKQSGESFGFDS